MSLRSGLALALALVAPSADAQDRCGTPGLSATEQTVCEIPALTWREEALNRLSESRGDTADLQLDQAEWVLLRDACQRDVPCLKDAYDRRIAEFYALAERPAAALRPWCSSARLNAAERTICGTPDLADLDAALATLYGAMRSQDADQDRWLRQERDGCRDDDACLREAYVERIRVFGRRLRAKDLNN